MTSSEVFAAIHSFSNYLEKKYGSNDNELFTWCQMFKCLIAPLLENLKFDTVLPFRKKLSRAQQRFVITQVDKDSSGIAFACKKIAHKLAKRFIYGPKPREIGLFERIDRPIEEVVGNLKDYSYGRGCYSTDESLPQFKVIMKMHKNS